MSDNRPFSLVGLVIVVVFLLGLAVLGIVATLKPDAVTIIDFGRMTAPIPAIHVDEPAGAVIIYLDTEIVNTQDAYVEAIGSLDKTVRTLAGARDEWVYYFDTTSDGALFFAIRCQVDDLDLPVGERRCQTSSFPPGRVPIQFLYDNGFLSTQD